MDRGLPLGCPTGVTETQTALTTVSMQFYIRSSGNISPQNTFGQVPFLAEAVVSGPGKFSCLEPDYRQYIDAKMIRRMSRIIKMGVAAAQECLKAAGLQMPDAIITGTAYGCLEDTGLFLTKMVEQQEELLTPTAFIQSTHNTVGAQIALMLQCHNYNNTFVHRGFSFESALLDAAMLLGERPASQILVGGLDEITGYSHELLSRLGLYKGAGSRGSAGLFSGQSSGTIGGEGACFFVVTGSRREGDWASVDAMTTFYKPDSMQTTCRYVDSFLDSQGLAPADIDLVITGRNGDFRGDEIYRHLLKDVLGNPCHIPYKHLCGEYPTSTAFAIWLAARILQSGSVPAAAGTGPAKTIRRVLVYNHYHNIHHSLFMLTAC